MCMSNRPGRKIALMMQKHSSVSRLHVLVAISIVIMHDICNPCLSINCKTYSIETEYWCLKLEWEAEERDMFLW